MTADNIIRIGFSAAIAAAQIRSHILAEGTARDPEGTALIFQNLGTVRNGNEFAAFNQEMSFGGVYPDTHSTAYIESTPESR